MPDGRAPAPRFLQTLLALPPDHSLAIVFPGQGSQKVGMGADIVKSFPAAREIFNLADRVLETPLSRVCFEGPDDLLTSTDNAQPAILATSLALLAAAIESATLAARPAYLAGHSLGEYTALVAAGSLAPDDALLLVRERGRLMAEAGATSPGALAAILGLDEATADEICAESGAEPANYNLDTQTVVGGTPEAVHRAMEMAKQRGGKALPVKVSGAFHTSLMASAAARFAETVDGVQFIDPEIPVISNVTGQPMTRADEIRDDLREQIRRPVRWNQTVSFLSRAGIARFIEVGPGRVLTNMLKRGAPDAEVQPIDSAEALGAASHV